MLLRVLWRRYAGIGFLTGMVVGNLIAWMSRMPSTVIVSAALVSWVGSYAGALVAQTLISGLYGAAGVCGMLLYQIDRWSLAHATIMHYLIVAALYIPMALILGWVERPVDLLIGEGFQAIAFFLIWLIMRLRYKAQVNRLNCLLEKNVEKQ